MSAKAVNEASGKNLLNKVLTGTAAAKCRFASVNKDTDWNSLLQDNPWLKTEVSHISANNCLNSLITSKNV